METVQFLLERNYKVVFLGPLPGAQRPVASECAATQLLWRKPITEMTLNRNDPTRVDSYNQRFNYWRSGIASLNARFNDRLVTVDLNDVFCDPEKCWFVHDGIGLFSDADHLTPAGAQRVMPKLLTALNQ